MSAAMRLTLVLAVVSTFTLVKTWKENDADAELYGQRQRRAASDDSVPSAEVSGGARVTRDTSFKPKVAGKEPQCAHGSTFCTDAEDYPLDYLSGLLPNEEKLKDYFGVDKDIGKTDGEVGQRIGPVDGDSLCKSQEMMIFPKAALNKDDEWLYVVNVEPDYIQGIKVEVCESGVSSCKLSDAFPPGYTSYCQQKYTYRKLIAIKEDGKPAPDSFKIPSCCSCFYRTTSAGSRFLPANNSAINRPRG